MGLVVVSSSTFLSTTVPYQLRVVTGTLSTLVFQYGGQRRPAAYFALLLRLLRDELEAGRFCNVDSDVGEDVRYLYLLIESQK